MRVNHTGEICAQALYQGQALTARRADVREKMEQAAREENDHLAWTEARIREVGGHTSYLNPLFYAGSFALGAVAGLVGDKWSLGFLAETERQVVDHLNTHLSRLPAQDERSRAIVERMREEEGHHATVAIEAGAAELPAPVKRLMRFSSKLMTTTTHWI
jgi:3-demethoxyubiquinol 3-hydroxylase